LPFLPAVRSGAPDGGGAPARVVPTVGGAAASHPLGHSSDPSIRVKAAAFLRSVQSPRPPIGLYRRGTNLPPATHSSSGCPASASRPPRPPVVQLESFFKEAKSGLAS